MTAIRKKVAENNTVAIYSFAKHIFYELFPGKMLFAIYVLNIPWNSILLDWKFQSVENKSHQKKKREKEVHVQTHARIHSLYDLINVRTCTIVHKIIL